ncbi:MAG: phage/plasmid primase, P4 family, partial [Planctomycetota bacterium]
MNTYAAAEKYLASGLSVIPIMQKPDDIAASKRPLVKWSQYQATRPKPEQLEKWFNGGQTRNIAVLGGTVSGNVIWLDFDDTASYQDWADEYPQISDNAPTQYTGKGFHVGVKMPSPPPGNQDIYYYGSHVGETRGEGGYIVAAPSIHGSGRVYEWIRAPWDVPFPVINDLDDIGLMTKEPPADVGQRAANIAATNGRARGDDIAVNKAISTVLGKLAAATDGHRNTALNEAAFSLGGLVAAGRLSRSEAEYSLQDVALAIGLGERETLATIASGLKAGEAAPLDVTRPVTYERRAARPGDDDPGDDTPPPADLLPFPAADEGNAQAVLLLHGDRYLYTDELGWLYYNDKHWAVKGAAARLNRAIVDTLIERRAQAVRADLEPIVNTTKPTANNVRGCKYMLQDILWATIDDFDNNPDELNCDNGVVNLQTGEISPHGHAQRFTYCITTPYDPQADDSDWATWLYSSVAPAGCDDDGRYADLAAWLQMAAGYSLTGHTHEQCLFFLQGPPRAGKGVFLQTLDKLLGRPLSSGVDFDTFTAQRGGDNQNFDLAPLKSCRMITATESERTTMLNAKRVKSITGNDPVYCAHKRKDFFTYTPQYKIWLSSNFKVMAQADDDALWSRLRIINFPNSHLGKEDFGLEQRLWAGRQGILKWAVEGAIAWYQRKAQNIGLGRPEIVKNAVKSHRNENDTVAQFIDDCCLVGPEQYAVGAQLT